MFAQMVTTLAGALNVQATIGGRDAGSIRPTIKHVALIFDSLPVGFSGGTDCPSAISREMNISPQDSVSGQACIANLRALAVCAPAWRCTALRGT